MRSLTRLRVDACGIFDAGLKAVDPARAIERHVHREHDQLKVGGVLYELAKYRRLYIAGAGKAAAKMAAALEEILGDRIAAGVVIVKYGHSLTLNRVRVVEAAHPVPDAAGMKATRQVVELMERAGERDLVFFLVSGGGSALFPCPAEGVTLEEKQRTTQILLDCGATIDEMNILRKHLSKVKGGRLARLASPATLVSLILSDVIGDRLETIASGPTVPDTSTFSDCRRIIQRYGLQGEIPLAVGVLLDRGVKGEVEETPKPADPVFDKAQNAIVGSNRLALEGAREKAQALGYNIMILSSLVAGETRSVAGVHAAIAKEITQSDNPLRRPACVISGGETTVTIRGTGLGGRNQEFALAAAIEIDGIERIVILSAGTDGTDGPTDAAGGIVDGATIQRGKTQGLDASDYLERNDSYPFLQATNDLLITGPTFTNVMDLHVMLVG